MFWLMTAMVRATVLHGFVDVVRSLGGDPSPLLRRQGLTKASLATDDALIPLIAQIRLLESAAHALNCPDFGLRMAKTQAIDVLGPLAIVMQSASTVAEAASSASRYLFVHNTGIALSIEELVKERAAVAEFRFELMQRTPSSTRQWIDMVLGFTHQLLQSLARDSYRPMGILLPHTPIAPISTYKHFFGTTIRIAQPHAALFVRRDVLNRPLLSANKDLQRIAIGYIHAHYSDSGENLTAQVRLAIRRRIGTGKCSREDISQLLSMHPRTLQRRLSEEATTFASINDSVCREEALRYLSSTDLPLTQIALLIGLAHPSALVRACRRWFNSSPSALRLAGRAPR